MFAFVFCGAWKEKKKKKKDRDTRDTRDTRDRKAGVTRLNSTQLIPDSTRLDSTPSAENFACSCSRVYCCVTLRQGVCLFYIPSFRHDTIHTVQTGSTLLYSILYPRYMRIIYRSVRCRLSVCMYVCLYLTQPWPGWWVVCPVLSCPVVGLDWTGLGFLPACLPAK